MVGRLVGRKIEVQTDGSFQPGCNCGVDAGGDGAEAGAHLGWVDGEVFAVMHDDATVDNRRLHVARTRGVDESRVDVEERDEGGAFVRSEERRVGKECW